MTAPVFVDTNILVYWRDARDRAKQARAAVWLERLWQERLGRTSIQVLSEYYVTVTRKLDPGLPVPQAWDDVSALFAWSPMVINETLMQRGHETEQRYKLSWWDSLIVAAAQLQGCGLLLSEDFQDGTTYGGVTVRSPFTLAVNEPAPPYVVSRAAETRHRRRGRPRGARSSPSKGDLPSY
jgi:predicted nucleic acid-binding protein